MPDGDEHSPANAARRAGVSARQLAIVALLLLPVATLITGSAAYLLVAGVPAVLLIPLLLFREPPAPPGSSDGEDDDDGGSRRPDPPLPLPSGGLPLRYSQPARRRYHGTPRTTLIPVRERRPAREPVRPRVPTHAG